ncbi:MAG TPA: metallopeptidase TldD-related protein, partial [bacterium]|nr:metallopeptidase TldD-related protein [bacterium]
YELTAPGQRYPEFSDADPEIRDRPWDTINRLRDELRESVDREPAIEVASSEFFIDHTHVRLINSRGLDLSSEHSKLTWDICLLYKENGADTEFWEMKFRPGAQYVNVRDDIARFARYARDAATAQVPRSGVCPVVLTGDNLYVLLQYFMHHSSAGARYQNASLFEPGKPVLPESARGDALTIYSNAIHPGGIRSWRFDGEGNPGARTAIIENGVLTRYWATSQYAHYLDIPKTGVFGNFDIPPGTVSWDDLFKSNDRVILVVQFSTFDPQPVAGNYLGEIRVGYEFRADGSVIPLRGGSVTGNVVQGMLNCRFCRERETFYGYVGPRGIRFEHAQIAGD